MVYTDQILREFNEGSCQTFTTLMSPKFHNEIEQHQDDEDDDPIEGGNTEIRLVLSYFYLSVLGWKFIQLFQSFRSTVVNQLHSPSRA